MRKRSTLPAGRRDLIVFYGEKGFVPRAVAEKVGLRVQQVVPVLRAHGLLKSAAKPSHRGGEGGIGDRIPTLVPPHVRNTPPFTPQWWTACDEAFRRAMIDALRQAAAERDNRAALGCVAT